MRCCRFACLDLHLLVHIFQNYPQPGLYLFQGSIISILCYPMLFAISSLTHPTLCLHRARQHLYQGVCRRGMQCGQKPSKPDLSPLQCAGNLNLKEEEKHPEPSSTYDSMILWSETLPSKNRTFRHCHRALNPTPTIVIVPGTQHHPDQFRWRQKPPLLN